MNHEVVAVSHSAKSTK